MVATDESSVIIIGGKRTQNNYDNQNYFQVEERSFKCLNMFDCVTQIVNEHEKNTMRTEKINLEKSTYTFDMKQLV